MAEEQSIDSQLKESLGKKSDWNLTIIHFKRWGMYLESLGQFAYQVELGNYQFLENLYAAEKTALYELHGLMKEMKPDMWADCSKLLEESSQMIKEMKKKTDEDDGSYNVNEKLVQKLTELFQLIHDFIQISGMGIPTRKNIDDEERLNRALK